MQYISSWIDVKININPGGYFYGKTKKTNTGKKGFYQQLADVEETMAEEESVIETAGTSSANATTNAGADAEAQEAPKPAAVEMMVMVNGAPITLKGKSSYVFVEVFDYINFDLSHANGRSIVTQLNGRQAQYMEPLTPGDVIEIYWKER